MELTEQITALEAEKKHLINAVQEVGAERTALDQMYIGGIKEILALRKEVVIKNEAINNLNVQIQTLLKEKEANLAEIKTLSERAIEL